MKGRIISALGSLSIKLLIENPQYSAIFEQTEMLLSAPIDNYVRMEEDNWCNGTCKALVFVEDDIAPYIKESLDIWEDDIAREYNASTQKITVSNERDEKDLRNKIWEEEDIADQDVFVVLLIGDIPYFRAYIQEGDDENTISHGFPGTFPSDFYLYDLHKDEKYPYNNTVGAYNASDREGFLYEEKLRPFVVGRIPRYSEDLDESAEKINAYFTRNHQHRRTTDYGL